MRKVFFVRLTTGERCALQDVCARGVTPARTVLHARILLKADQRAQATGVPAGPAWPDARICEAVDVSRATVARVRKRYVVAGLDAVLARKRPPPRQRKLDGAAAAHLIATACSTPPAGHERWTLRLLAGRLVELEQVDTVSHETVRTMLKKPR